MITVLMLALVVVGLLAQTSELREAKEAPVHPMMRWREDLNLTQKQIDSITEARTAYDKQRNTVSAQIKNLNVDLTEAIKKQDFKNAKKLNKQITDKELELKNARLDMLAAMIKDLSAEQKESFLARHPMHSAWGNQGFRNFGQLSSSRGYRDGSGYQGRSRREDRNTGLRQFRDNKHRFRQASPRK